LENGAGFVIDRKTLYPSNLPHMVKLFTFRRFTMKTTAIALLTLASLLPARADVVCSETSDTISVSVDGKPVLVYQKSIKESPQGIDPIYRRSGYIHSIKNPAGQTLTGDFAADHAHQHALFFAWRQVSFEGRQTDFWDQKTDRGRTFHHSVEALQSGEDSGMFTVTLRHEDQTAVEAPKDIIRETWTITVYDRGQNKDAFVFDLEQTQTNVADSPIVIEKYHYGGMALRGNSQWLSTETDAVGITTNEGKSREEGNHSRPNWVDMHGPIDGKMAGIAVLSHPANFRHPQPVRLHPNKPYFCFSPMVESGFSIGAGKTYRGRYRYVAHNGAAKQERIDAEWQAFSKTPAENESR